MKVWTALKRLNHRFDCWSAHAADKIVTDLDGAGDKQEPDTKRHVNVWDLLVKDRRSSTREAVKGE